MSRNVTETLPKKTKSIFVGTTRLHHLCSPYHMICPWQTNNGLDSLQEGYSPCGLYIILYIIHISSSPYILYTYIKCTLHHIFLYHPHVACRNTSTLNSSVTNKSPTKGFRHCSPTVGSWREVANASATPKSPSMINDDLDREESHCCGDFRNIVLSQSLKCAIHKNRFPYRLLEMLFVPALRMGSCHVKNCISEAMAQLAWVQLTLHCSR